VLQVGQLNKEGTRVTFKTNGNQTGMNTNPNYMKAWAEAANEMKDQGKSAILDGFWPQIDSQEVISKHSPTKKKNDTKKAWEEVIEVEEQESWMTKTPVKSGPNKKKYSLPSRRHKQKNQHSLPR
jgi:hypothetical protein